MASYSRDAFRACAVKPARPRTGAVIRHNILGLIEDAIIAALLSARICLAAAAVVALVLVLAVPSAFGHTHSFPLGEPLAYHGDTIYALLPSAVPGGDPRDQRPGPGR
jgi:hypothetical protein